MPEALQPEISVFAGRPGAKELTGAQPWVLRAERSFWFVLSGEVDVFGVRLEQGRPVGARRNIMRAPAGAILAGMPDASESPAAGLVAAAAGSALVLPLQADDLAAVAARPETRQQAAAMLETWINGLSTALPIKPRPHDLEEPPQSGTLMLRAGQAAGCSTKLICARVKHGKVLLDSSENHPLPAEAGWFPLAPCNWLMASAGAELEFVTIEKLMADGENWLAMLDAFHAVLRLGMAIRAQVVNEDSLRRIREREEAIKNTMSLTLARQSAVLDAEWQASLSFNVRDDELLAACGIIGRRAGITFRQPPPHARSDRYDPIRAVARASRVRVRRVTLQGEWWRGDHGPLLAFFGDDKRPVALLPVSARRYNMVNPATRQTCRVTEKIARRLDPAAHFFYRPLPDGALGGWDIARYALRGRAGDLRMAIGMGLLGGLLSLVTPFMTALIFNTIIPAAKLGQLAQIGLGFAVAALAGVSFSIVKAIALLRVEGHGDNALQSAVWDRVLELPASFFRRFSAGDLANRVMGINVIRQMLSGTVLTTILSGFFSVFNLLLIFYYSWKLAILAVILVLVASCVTYIIARSQLKHQRSGMDLHGKTSGMVFQFVSAIAKLRDTACEARVFALWSELFLRKKEVDVKAVRIANIGATFNAAYPVLCSLATFAIYFFFLETSMKTGDFLAYNAAFSQFLAALLGMSGSLITLVNIKPVYERAKPIFDEPVETDFSKADPGLLHGRVEINHVFFRYHSDGPPVLRDVSITAQPGEFVAIVGPSGAGKSTLFRLLLGFEAPESGAVLFDGQDLRNLDLRALRRQISVVLQNGQVFAGDIFHNITGAASGLTHDDAWEAAEAAALADDLRALPMGLNTYIPENGATLSGGQRQRLMIARAIAARPAMIFFDEATSSIDNRAQSHISQSLKALKATRIIVAQRLSTVQEADTIYVMDAGKIVQKGSFNELMEQPGLFRELAQRQLL